MAEVDSAKLLNAIEKSVGINEQLYALKQHTKAITNPKEYYDGYTKAIETLKTQMAEETKKLIDEVAREQKTYGYTDDLVANIVGQQMQALYNSKLAQIQHAYPILIVQQNNSKLGEQLLLELV